MKPIPMGLVAVVCVLLASNLLASSLVGLGDGEALYYCYGRHPSLSYLDHPPLIGWLLYISTESFGTSIWSVRLVPMAMTTFTVLFTYLLAKDMFGPKAALYSVLLLGATPVFSVGMIAATPDAPLAALFSLFAWQLYRAGIDGSSNTWSRVGRPMMLGAIVGLAFLSKYTGVGLVLTTLLIIATRKYRIWIRRPGFWMGAILAAIGTVPVILWNETNDYASVYHRLVWTQGNAGFSLRNLGALVGGQLLYIGPLMLISMALGSRFIWRQSRGDQGTLVLLFTSVPTLAITYLLTLWSEVAEPHWPAVGYLPLFVAGGRWIERAGRRALKWAGVTIVLGWTTLALLHVIVLTPLVPGLAPKETYTPEYDLGNELRGWSEVALKIRDINSDRFDVVAPFYTQCSQLFFALGEPNDPDVRCVSKTVDDFDFWYPTYEPQIRPVFLVTDNRFTVKPSELLPDMEPAQPPLVVSIRRADTVVRRFEIIEMRPRRGLLTE